MAACGSLQHIFENPLPETTSTSSLFSLSSTWNKITSTTTSSMKPVDDSSFTEIFGELHFKESHHVPKPSPSPSSSSNPVPLSSLFSSFMSSSSSSSSLFSYTNQHQPGIETQKPRLNMERNGNSWVNNNNIERSKSCGEFYYPTSLKRQYKHSNSFSSPESLSLCTEGLGFESSDDQEDLKGEISLDSNTQQQKNITRHKQQQQQQKPEISGSENRRSRTGSSTRGSFPPPISCIGKNGKPWVHFKSHREDGRFILKEIRIPTQEFLQACREDGRLKLKLIQSDDDEEEEEDETDDDLEGVDQEDEQEQRQRWR